MNQQQARLFVVPTPIGNMGDITLRALEVLKSVDLILAEDTRKTGLLLKHYSISCPLLSYHMHNEHRIAEKVIDKIRNGENIALVSDAGTPGISDPGYLLVSKLVSNNLNLETLPGATAFVPALINSGFPTDRFVFEGFLPHKKGRKSRFEAIAKEEKTTVIYESPHRLLKTLGQLAEYLEASRLISVSREITKIYEESIRGSSEEVKAYYEKSSTKGEFVIVVSGKKK